MTYSSPASSSEHSIGGPSRKRVQRSDSMPIDKTDAKILRVLQTDARISNVALAECVHLSPTAVFDRVKRLVSTGIIVGFEARLNPLKVGMGLTVIVEVSLEHNENEALERFAEAVRGRSEILECHFVAGSYDYLLKVRVSNMNAYQESVARLLRSLPFVRESRSYAVVEEVKNSVALPV